MKPVYLFRHECLDNIPNNLILYLLPTLCPGILYRNNLADRINKKRYKFADDTVLSSRSNNLG